jgi:hypothetical protein
MTRKDYIILAQALGQALKTEIEVHGEQGETVGGVRLAASTVATYLGYDNPRFNREHFLSVVRGEKDLNSRPARRRV